MSAALQMNSMELGPKGRGLSAAEEKLIEAGQLSRSGSIRRGVAKLYLTGEFGHRDFVSAYVWTLAAWNVWDGSFDEKVNLAQTQRYLEFILNEAEKHAAVQRLTELLPDEEAEYVVNKPFNAGWWGWDGDDPVLPEPPSRYFKEWLVLWLRDSGWKIGELTELLNRCAPCDGSPTLRWRHPEELFDELEARGESPIGAELKEEYDAWLADKCARRA